MNERRKSERGPGEHHQRPAREGQHFPDCVVDEIALQHAVDRRQDGGDEQGDPQPELQREQINRKEHRSDELLTRSVPSSISLWKVRFVLPASRFPHADPESRGPRPG
jgi:hypothetical protein